MDTSTNPETMTLDELFAEITDLAQQQSRTEFVTLFFPVDFAMKVARAEYLAGRLTTLFEEIRRRVELSSQG